MRKMLLVALLLTSCTPEHAQEPPPPPFNPEVYVIYDCGDPCHDHERPEDATLDPEWPPVICVGDCR